MKFVRLFSSLVLLSAGLTVLPLAAQVPVANPASISLSTPTGSFTAVTQTITVTGAAGESWRVQAIGGFWLRFLVTPTCGAPVNDCTTTTAGSTTITIVADPTGLPNYLYTGSLTISYPGGVLSIPVNLNVGGGANAALVTATPASLSFSATPSGTSQSQSLAIGSVNTSTAPYVAVTSNATWLTTSLGGSSTFAPATITVTANPAGLAAGSYTGALTLTPAGGVASAITVPVTLTVASLQQLVVNPAAVNFSGGLGGSGLSPVTVSVGVASGSPVTYTASISYPGIASQNWLSTNLTTGQTGTNLTLSASGAGNLPAGTYSATVTIASPGLAPVYVPVSLTISGTSPGPGGSPSFVADANPISFNVPPGVPASRTITISASNLTNVPFTVGQQYTTPGANWLTVTPTIGVTPAVLQITVNAGSLPPAGYSANLTIFSSNSPNFPSLTIPVTMTVTTGQLVSSAPAALSFSYAGSGSVSSTQTLQLAVSPASPSPQATVTAITDVAGQGWLTAVLLSATPGTITPGAQVGVSVNAAGLPNGTYTGRVQISVPSVTNPLLQVPVTLTVSGGGSAPTVLFSPNQFSFTAVANGATLDQNLTLTTNTATSVPYSLTANVPWIAILNANTTTPSTPTIRVNPAGLAAGVYSGSITLNAPGALNNGALIPVTLTVTTSAQPLTLSPASVSFVAQANGTPPAPRNVLISSPNGAIPYTVTSNQSWLQGIASTDNTPGNIAVYVNPAGLAAGIYSGNLTATSSGFTANLPVTLEITSGPLLRLSQQTVTFNYQTGQGFPAPRTILITASTGGVVGAAITTTTASGGNWLVAPTTVQTPGAFALSLANGVVATLAPGSYAGTVTVSAPGTTTLSSTINVTLNVSSTALLTLSTAPVSFNAETNGNPPPSQTRSVASTGGTLNLLAGVTTNTGSGWLTATLNSSTTPSTLTIGASPAGLSAGVYTGSVTVSSGASGTVAAGANALVIPVTLTVGSALSLNVDKSELIFSGAGAATPQTLQVSSTSGNLSFGVGANVSNSSINWLSVSSTSGVTPSTVTVFTNPAGLNEGSYFGTITLTPQTAGSTPILIPVTLIVNRSSPLQVTPTTLNFSYPRGGAIPGQQSVQVTSSQPLNFTFTSAVQTPVGGNWLSVGQSGVQTNGSLQVSLNSNVTALAAGNYTATITVIEPASQSIVPITVNLTVSAPTIGTLVATPNTINLTGRIGQGNPPPQTVQVTSTLGSAPLSFNVTSDVLWLSAVPLAGTTPTILTISVNASAVPSGNAVAIGHLTLVPLIGGQTTTVTVSFTNEPSPAPAISAFANSATFQPGPLTPGMLFTIVGTDLGPATAVNGTIANGRFTTSVAGVRVLFDGIPAPILFASSTQINAAVPYQLFGRAFAQMTVEYNGVSSTALAPRLADSAPGIFTTDSRQAAALNADTSINSPANPAPAGTIVVLYVTGEGQTTPGGVDGEIVPATNLKRPLGTVRVRVNGIDVPATDILYAGSAPSLVSGLMQINFRLPANAPSNAATPVDVFVGAAQSPVGTTIAVRQ